MKKDHAGVYIPPPIIYAGIYLAAWLIQKALPISKKLMETGAVKFMGIIFFLLALYLGLRGVNVFIRTGNTLMTVKPASSLQQKGIYKITRNPMYLGLISAYLGFTCFFGNWWHVILLPVLFGIIQEYVIRREEKYLERKFGDEYRHYRTKVKRWL